MNSHVTLRVTKSFSNCNYLILRRFYATKKLYTNLSKLSKSSQEWVTRQINDPYVKRAKMENYRARSAFKLIEIDDKFKILKPGDVVVDCGASPGAWTQVVVPRIFAENTENRQGKVIAVDLNYISPIQGAVTIIGDFTYPSIQQLIINELDGTKPDVILSDMAPNAIGLSELDNKNIVGLALSALTFAIKHLKPGGTFLCKVWDGYEVVKVENNLERFFASTKRIKPLASRKNSAEMFLLGRQFKGTI